ncbi:hypothetical protein QQF64_003663 [Cirrhinus molitorella]|uniref:Reelin n=1 Tax=Cirrhinus molitorella TaxID=172907 RepID=A0ABR3MLY8_9TELE
MNLFISCGKIWQHCAPRSWHCECACGSTGAGRGSCESVPAFTLQDSPGSSAVTAGLLPSALSQTLLLKITFTAIRAVQAPRLNIFQYGSCAGWIDLS